jgi:hypothetical protein
MSEELKVMSKKMLHGKPLTLATHHSLLSTHHFFVTRHFEEETRGAL